MRDGLSTNRNARHHSGDDITSGSDGSDGNPPIVLAYVRLQYSHEQEHPLDLILHLRGEMNRGALVVVEEVAAVGREAHDTCTTLEGRRRLEADQAKVPSVY